MLKKAELISAASESQEPSIDVRASRELRPIKSLKVLIAYLISVSACIALLVNILHLKGTSLSVPFIMWSDSRLYRALFKGMIENGWYVFNPALGAPLGMDMHDWIPSDYGNFLIVKLIAIFFPNPEITFNLYYLLSFPLTCASSLFVLRRLGFSFAPSFVGSILFTYLPYHFFRIDHIFLSCYYIVPLLVMVILFIAQNRPLFVSGDLETGKIHAKIAERSSLLCLGIFILAAASGTYYAFFGCFFIIIAGIYASILNRSILPSIRAMLLTACAIVTLLLCMSSAFVYWHQHGRNPEAIERSSDQAETYGLKIAQLVLPIPTHRIPILARLRFVYDQGPLNNENFGSSMGVVGSLGFLSLIACLLIPMHGSKQWWMFRALATLNIFGVLLATIGGFGSVLALMGLTQIRGYNRISVFLAFFSILAVVGFLEVVRSRSEGRQSLRFLAWGFMAIVLVFGIWDQTLPRFWPPYREVAKRYFNDADFIRTIEASVPKGAMIFQLPYIRFPEVEPPLKMQPYEHLEAYLHSRHLRWSFGAMKGREAERWQTEIAAKPLPEMVQSLVSHNFSGIYVDRFGYADSEKVVNELSQIIGSAPLTSRNGRLVFFNISKAGERPLVTPPPVEPVITEFSCDLVANAMPKQMNLGQAKVIIDVEVTNRSGIKWLAFLPGRPITDSVNVSYRWWRNTQMVMEGGRAKLPADLEPGKKARVALEIIPPKIPGTYTLRVELVKEGVSWFSDAGSCKAEAMVNVVP